MPTPKGKNKSGITLIEVWRAMAAVGSDYGLAVRFKAYERAGEFHFVAATCPPGDPGLVVHQALARLPKNSTKDLTTVLYSLVMDLYLQHSQERQPDGTAS